MRSSTSSSVELELPWWPSLSTSQPRSAPYEGAVLKAPRRRCPREEEGRLAVFYAQDEAGVVEVPAPVGDGAGELKHRVPQRELRAQGGMVTKRPFSAAVSSKRVKAPELSNSVYGAKSVPTSKFYDRVKPAAVVLVRVGADDVVEPVTPLDLRYSDDRLALGADAMSMSGSRPRRRGRAESPWPTSMYAAKRPSSAAP